MCRRRGSRSFLLGGDGLEERRLVPPLDPHVLQHLSVQRVVGDEEGHARVAVLDEAGVEAVEVAVLQPAEHGVVVAGTAHRVYGR